MSSVVVLCPDVPPDDPSKGIPQKAAELLALLAETAPNERLQVADVALRRMLTWSVKLPKRDSGRVRKHLEHLEALPERSSSWLEAVEQALKAVALLARGAKPDEQPDWVSRSLVEKTLTVFQPKYTTRHSVLLTDADAVDIICGFASLTEIVG